MDTSVELFHIPQSYTDRLHRLASMCLSRYILHLRAINPAGGTSNTSLHLSRMSDLRFAQSHVVGLVDPEVDASPQMPTEITGDNV